MGWFSSGKSEEERNADLERDNRRAISEQKAKQLAWAEKEAAKNPDSKLARGILEANRNNL